MSSKNNSTIPAFCQGIQHFGDKWPDFDRLAAHAVIAEGKSAIDNSSDDACVYQTLLAADALRYLTLQVTGSKGSGHPGGFASSAEAHASLMMLGHTNIVTEVGHHAPGFYSSMFLDCSLEDMGIHNMDDMMQRFRERHGLLVIYRVQFLACWLLLVLWARVSTLLWLALIYIGINYFQSPSVTEVWASPMF